MLVSIANTATLYCRDIAESVENIGEQVNKNVEEYLKEHGFRQREENEKKTLKGQIKGLGDSENPVLILMCKLLRILYHNSLPVLEKK